VEAAVAVSMTVAVVAQAEWFSPLSQCHQEFSQ
jgi:hypothetical protein